jgi:hypothetical protein
MKAIHVVTRSVGPTIAGRVGTSPGPVRTSVARPALSVPSQSLAPPPLPPDPLFGPDVESPAGLQEPADHGESARQDPPERPGADPPVADPPVGDGSTVTLGPSGPSIALPGPPLEGTQSCA